MCKKSNHMASWALFHSRNWIDHKTQGSALQQQRAFQIDLIQYCRNTPGGRLNKKDGLTRYGDSHVKDKTS